MVNNKPLTTTETRELSPELLRNEIDQRIVKIRPMSTPIDQITRLASSRPVNNMQVDYYSVDAKPTETSVVSGSISEAAVNGHYVATLKLKDGGVFQPTDTAIFPAVTITKGTQKYNLIVYVLSAELDTIKVIAINNTTDGVSSFPAGTNFSNKKIIRMGRAATELDVQTPQFEALPQKESNLCQIFKTQIEQSTIQRMADKEANWTFNDQEEVAITDMRLAMEKSFLFGHRTRFIAPDKNEEVLLTGGIWWQAGKEHSISIDTFQESDMVALCRTAFTESGGSSKKILLAGSNLITMLHSMEYSKVLTGTQTVTKWGIDFTEYVTKFGTLYIVMSELFDQCGHANDGIIIDPEYITKYIHTPLHIDRLDLRTSGVRNTEAVVVTEASCIVLRHPRTHIRVVCK
ncbi:MAG: DUF5309 family protein [Muribaculaceae bacterium]|nr:DUF5309 family protein [Muribaculaceae bacterium]